MSTHDPLQPHSHEPNPSPPSDDPTLQLITLSNGRVPVTVEMLRQLPQSTVSNCYIVSTGHGTSGPFQFDGTALIDFLADMAPGERAWQSVEVVSEDGFGTRINRTELEAGGEADPILLAYGLEGRALTRKQGLVRLIVPAETDDALRQVKWVQTVRILTT